MQILHAVKSLQGPGVTSLRFTSRFKTVCGWVDLHLQSSTALPPAGHLGGEAALASPASQGSGSGGHCSVLLLVPQHRAAQQICCCIPQRCDVWLSQGGWEPHTSLLLSKTGMRGAALAVVAQSSEFPWKHGEFPFFRSSVLGLVKFSSCQVSNFALEAHA